MKRCPTCNRAETDEALGFCRVDGTALVADSGSVNTEAGTSKFNPASASPEIETSILPHRSTTPEIHRSTGPTTLLPAGSSQITTQELSKPKRSKLLWALVGLGIVVIVASVGGYFYWSRDNNAIDSIAVLPFTNATGDKEIDFLSEGIAETLINNFTRISDLKVTARSTAFRYRGREGEPQVVGRELGVGSVLTGKLLQRGDTLSIQVDLIKTSDGVQIWGNRYEGKSADIVSIQQRIASDISAQLKLKLTGAQQQQIAKTYTQNPDAYQHYLRGRYHWNKRTAEDMKKGLQEFQAAADIDPGYPLAYVGLADCYVLLEEYAGVPSNETLPKAQAFAQKALQIDDSIGEAHATLGLVNGYMWRWAEAEVELKRAIELNPNYPTAYHWYNIILTNSGRYDEAMAVIKRAQELDPLSGIIGVNVGIIHLRKKDPSSAATEFKRIVEFDPNWWGGHFYLGASYLKLGRTEEALTELLKSVEMTNRSGRSIAFLGYAYGLMGRHREAQAIIKELGDKYARREATGQNLAAVYVGLGDKDEAFAWLEKDLQARSGDLVRISWYPPFDSLRSEPRFKDLLKRMGVAE
jgi:TolB-like protein/Flp pilus assembly protein TadD